MMNKVYDENGEKYPGTVADQITVELHNETDYLTIEHTASNVDLNTNGTATVTVPATFSGMYYLTIKTRNHLETVSAAVVDFSGSTIGYDFSTAASQAYGDNMKDVGEGVYAIYAGDMAMAGTAYPDPTVPDGVIDVDDVYYIYNAYVIDNLVGFYPSDINGDSSVDINDVYLAYDNYLLNIYVQTP
jgi:hypothetical protein